MKASLITEDSRIASIEDEWRALAEQRGSAFVTPEWFRSWSEHRPDSASPLVAAARREDGSLAGVMPLVLDASRRPRVIRFAGASLGDRFVPAAREADEHEVAAAAMSALQDEGVAGYMVALDHVDQHAAWWQAMGAASRPQRAVTEQQQSEIAYIRLSDYDDWEQYLASRSRNFRQQIRRRERALRRDHEVELRAATDATLADDVGHLFDLHQRRWQGRARSSLAGPLARPVLEEFAERAQRRGWLRLRLLEVDGVPVAAFLGWRIGGSYAFFQSGFDPDWSQMSVGFVHLATTVRSALDEGAEEFDMLLGDEPYKSRFTNATRSVQTVILTRPRSAARVLVAGEAAARRSARDLAKRPAFSGIARSLSRLLPTSRRS
jgi:CelD/BcsL family acetyltransferase involved in cellulose biosynthesis